MNNISPVLPRFRSTSASNSAKVPSCLDAFANSTKSSRPTASFSAVTTASNGMEVVTLKRSISNLLLDTFILPPCIKAAFPNQRQDLRCDGGIVGGDSTTSTSSVQRCSRSCPAWQFGGPHPFADEPTVLHPG